MYRDTNVQFSKQSYTPFTGSLHPVSLFASLTVEVIFWDLFGLASCGDPEFATNPTS